RQTGRGRLNRDEGPVGAVCGREDGPSAAAGAERVTVAGFLEHRSVSDAPPQATTPVQGAYMTPCQVADLLQVAPATVYRWAAADPRVPPLRIGGIVRFRRGRLERWLREREQGISGRRRSPKQVLRALQVPAGMADRASAGTACGHPCDQEPPG